MANKKKIDIQSFANQTENEYRNSLTVNNAELKKLKQKRVRKYGRANPTQFFMPDELARRINFCVVRNEIEKQNLLYAVTQFFFSNYVTEEGFIDEKMKETINRIIEDSYSL